MSGGWVSGGGGWAGGMEGGEWGMTGWRLFLSYFGNKFIKFIFKIDCNEFTTFYRGFNLDNLKNHLLIYNRLYQLRLNT